MAISDADILRQLDVAAEELRFPALSHGYYYPAGVRLSLYRDGDHWALAIETLVFDNRAFKYEAFCDIVYVYGSDVIPESDPIESAIHPISDGPSSPLFDSEDVAGQMIAREVKDITLNGAVLSIQLPEEQFRRAGVILSDPPRVQGFELLRLLAFENKHKLFANEQEMHLRIGIEPMLILRLYDWYHPDILQGERPSDCETFVMLAKVIASGDVAKYQPTQKPNTAWTNWPTAGSI